MSWPIDLPPGTRYEDVSARHSPAWYTRIANVAEFIGVSLDPDAIEDTTGPLHIGFIGLADAERLHSTGADVVAVGHLSDGRHDIVLRIYEADDGEDVMAVCTVAVLPGWANDGS